MSQFSPDERRDAARCAAAQTWRGAEGGRVPLAVSAGLCPCTAGRGHIRLRAAASAQPVHGTACPALDLRHRLVTFALVPTANTFQISKLPSGLHQESGCL